MDNFLERVRQSVTIGEILATYGVEVWGNRAYCPIHGSDRQVSFSFNDEVYNCFQCGSKGSVLDLVAALENCDIYEAAALIATRYKIGTSEVGEAKKLLNRVEKYRSITESEFEEVSGFDLTTLEDFRGFSKEAIKHFGLAKTNQDEVYIPTRDLNGREVSYTLRRPEGVEPKYMNAKGISGRSVVYGLWENQHELKRKGQAIIVEGQLDCVSVWDKGFPNVVAICGSSMTVQQALTLMQFVRSLILMLDADEAGRKGTEEIMKKYRTMFKMRTVSLPEGKDPGDCTAFELYNALGGL